MDFVDHDELTMAIAYFVGALPHEPRWVLVLTDRGELLGQYRFKQSHHQHLVDLITNLQSHSSRVAREGDAGAFSYTLIVGTDGVQVTVPLGNDHLVCVNMPQVKSFDLLVKAIQEGLPPLKDTLGLR